MYSINEIKDKIIAGTWTSGDVQKCLDVWNEMEDLTSYTKEIYYVSYSVFSYNFREYVYPMIEICQQVKVHLETSKEKFRIYLALARLYFCLGFPPKVVEYGLKYANSGYTMKDPLKSVYNMILASFSDCGLFKEADIYLEKMMDLSRDNSGMSEDCNEESDLENELVYYDSKVYVKLGMGDLEGAKQASYHTDQLLEFREMSDKVRSFFLGQREFTGLYLRLYQQEPKAVIADEFNKYMKKMESGDAVMQNMSFCVCYFAEFLQILADEKRWEDVIRIGNYIKSATNFSGSFSPIYRILCDAAKNSENEMLKTQVSEYQCAYIRALEREKKSYDQMIRLLAKEELKIVGLKVSLERDPLTGCFNRSAFDRDCQCFMENHPSGNLIFIDLDYLKEINDCYGHENGDRYLVHFAESANRELAAGDRLYRYAGDEFLVLSAQPYEKIQAHLEKILEQSTIAFSINGEKCPISFSFGIVSFEEKKQKISALVKEADNRMYLCKERNHQRIWKRRPDRGNHE